MFEIVAPDANCFHFLTFKILKRGEGFGDYYNTLCWFNGFQHLYSKNKKISEGGFFLKIFCHRFISGKRFLENLFLIGNFNQIWLVLLMPFSLPKRNHSLVLIIPFAFDRLYHSYYTFSSEGYIFILKSGNFQKIHSNNWNATASKVI